MCFDGCGITVNAYHDTFDAGTGKRDEMTIDGRRAADRHQCLGSASVNGRRRVTARAASTTPRLTTKCATQSTGRAGCPMLPNTSVNVNHEPLVDVTSGAERLDERPGAGTY
jgi:hypothetical protein